MNNSTIETRNQWISGAWISLAALGLLLSACGSTPVREGCENKAQILETAAPWSGSCDQTHHDPFDQVEGRHSGRDS